MDDQEAAIRSAYEAAVDALIHGPTVGLCVPSSIDLSVYLRIAGCPMRQRDILARCASLGLVLADGDRPLPPRGDG